MQKNDEFFENGLAEILCSTYTSEPSIKEDTHKAELTKIQPETEKPFFNTDTIVRLLAVFIVIALLISFAFKIYLN